MIPVGTPIKIAPAVPYSDVRINGNIPYDGSAAVDFHSLPVINSTNPISFIAGIPEITRKSVIVITDTTETKPHRINMIFISLSKK
jgi:hypothetical protein